MKKALLLLLLSVGLQATAQNADDFYKNRCAAHTTKLTSASVFYPCSWKPGKPGGTILATWTYEVSEEDAIIESVMETPSSKAPGASRVAEILAKQSAQYKKPGELLWTRSVKVGNRDCAEVVTKNKKSLLVASLYYYTVQYTLPLDHADLSIVFLISSTSDAKAKELLNKYKQLFLNLAAATSFDADSK